MSVRARRFSETQKFRHGNYYRILNRDCFSKVPLFQAFIDAMCLSIIRALSIGPKLPVCIFGEFLWANGSAFSGMSRKEDNLASDSQMFGNFLPEISVPLDFVPRNFRNFRLNGSLFRN